MSGSFSGSRRVSMVTGAASGIGRAVAELLLSDRDAVIAVDRSERVTELEALGAVVERLDVGDPDARTSLAGRTDRLDALVNAAGIIRVAEIEDFTQTDWEDTFRVNTEAPFFLTQALLPRLASGGAIVNVTSMASKMSDDAATAYSASKAALAVVTRAFAARLGSRGIRVNSVSPGIILTPMQDEFLPFYAAREGTSEEAFQARRFTSVPLGRGGSAEEVARAIRFLLSDDASYITGEDLNVTGGLVTW
jgi:NAD(P)-dependent dehydrogenase (short-subunit alcohol dehydrogenase family)